MQAILLITPYGLFLEVVIKQSELTLKKGVFIYVFLTSGNT